MRSARVGLAPSFNIRNPCCQQEAMELYADVFRKSEAQTLLDGGWEPIGMSDGMAHFKRLKPCAERVKEREEASAS